LRAAVRAAWRVLARGRRRRCTLRGAFARFHSGYSRAAEDRGHRHRLLTQAVVLWLANSFARSWRSWRGRWSEAARARREYRRCVLRWASQHLSRGWMAWATATTERRRGRERVRVAILALTCLAQRRALNSWEAAHKADMRRRAALRIVDPRLRRMGAGFTRWFERAVQLGPIRRCLSRWRAQGHLRAWATWASTTEERHATLATLARALGHFRNRELSRGWATWAAAAVERQAAFALARCGGATAGGSRATSPVGASPTRVRMADVGSVRGGASRGTRASVRSGRSSAQPAARTGVANVGRSTGGARAAALDRHAPHGGPRLPDVAPPPRALVHDAAGRRPRATPRRRARLSGVAGVGGRRLSDACPRLALRGHLPDRPASAAIRGWRRSRPRERRRGARSAVEAL
jgi:hypothetical protein